MQKVNKKYTKKTKKWINIKKLYRKPPKLHSKAKKTYTTNVEQVTQQGGGGGTAEPQKRKYRVLYQEGK